MSGPQISWLPDGRRLHMNHGPIDLIVEAFGPEGERRAAYAQAAARFRTILDELVAELPELRKAVEAVTPTPNPSPQGGGESGEVCARISFGVGRGMAESPSPLWGGVRGGGDGASRCHSPTARRMEAACAPLAETFITPMAAVAGSVADEMLAAMVAGRDLDRAYVNDGGDIAIHLARGQSMRLAVAGTGHGFADRVEIDAASPVRGIATSGWRGRSFSLGIADAVTVLARCGAEADATATIIANAVDLPGHPAVSRKPANELALDSDLGGRLVTVEVGPLAPAEIAQALDAGLAVAEDLRRRGLIEGAALFLKGESRVCDPSDAAFLRAPLWPAGHLPLKGGDQPSHRLSPIFNVTSIAPTSKLPISPRVGEMAGRPEGGNVGRSPRDKRDPRSRASTGSIHA
jgi:ApbE superfamily uncharacterized protein (UPF0280 family)